MAKSTWWGGFYRGVDFKDCVYSSGPFNWLIVDERSITLRGVFARYEFTREEVVATRVFRTTLKRMNETRIIRGVQIEHRKADEKPMIIFTTFFPERLQQRLEALGYG